jgi:hypothetical protein
LRGVGQGGQEINDFRILAGIRYVADDAISSATAGWLLNNNAIKIFTGPTRAYTISDPNTETESYVTKSHMTPDRVDSSLIYIVTGITA